ncbi:MAG: (Fe-S)-binding protein [Opitutae bacterium]|nr:(Fe-S)-binding protein [Opitutae bacterium]
MDLDHRQLPGADKRVQLMATCICDAFYADVARATVEVLEYLGCRVEFPEGQTCCGQPAFNGGDWPASRKVVRHTVVRQLAHRTWELADFIVNGLGVKTWPGKFDATIALHRACHTRGTKTCDAAIALLGSIPGIKVVPVGEVEQCCGFGGTFSVSFPNVSANMGELKLEHIRAAKPDLLVSPDMSCMMHLGGLAEKEGKPIKIGHVAQVLRDSLKNAGLI